MTRSTMEQNAALSLTGAGAHSTDPPLFAATPGHPGQAEGKWPRRPTRRTTAARGRPKTAAPPVSRRLHNVTATPPHSHSARGDWSTPSHSQPARATTAPRPRTSNHRRRAGGRARAVRVAAGSAATTSRRVASARAHRGGTRSPERRATVPPSPAETSPGAAAVYGASAVAVATASEQAASSQARYWAGQHHRDVEDLRHELAVAKGKLNVGAEHERLLRTQVQRQEAELRAVRKALAAAEQRNVAATTSAVPVGDSEHAGGSPIWPGTSHTYVALWLQLQLQLAACRVPVVLTAVRSYGMIQRQAWAQVGTAGVGDSPCKLSRRQAEEASRGAAPPGGGT